MVVCEWRDSMDDYKVWEMVIHNGKDTLRYNDHYSPEQLLKSWAAAFVEVWWGSEKIVASTIKSCLT